MKWRARVVVAMVEGWRWRCLPRSLLLVLRCAMRCRPLSPELRQLVRQRWRAFYSDFGYPFDGDEEQEQE